MRKSIIALAALLTAGSVLEISSAEARGLRVGLSFGQGSGGLSPLADASILENANRRQQESAARRYVVPSAPGYATVNRRKAAAAAAAERRQAAAAAAAERRQAEARARAQKAAAARVRPAAETPVAATTNSKGGATLRDLEAAQETQRDKADELLKRLSKPAVQPTSAPATASPLRTPEVAPVETSAPATSRIVVAPSIDSEPPRTQVVKPAPVATPVAAPAPLKPTPAGDCRRFIPGAGVTVSVPCNE